MLILATFSGLNLQSTKPECDKNRNLLSYRAGYAAGFDQCPSQAISVARLSAKHTN